MIQTDKHTGGYRSQWLVELAAPCPMDPDVQQSAIERQCRHFNEGHSVEGDIDCIPPEEGIEWNYGELFVNLMLKSSIDITEDAAQDEAISFFNFFGSLWFASWFWKCCGEPKAIKITKL